MRRQKQLPAAILPDNGLLCAIQNSAFAQPSALALLYPTRAEPRLTGIVVIFLLILFLILILVAWDNMPLAIWPLRVVHLSRLSISSMSASPSLMASGSQGLYPCEARNTFISLHVQRSQLTFPHHDGG